MVVYTGKVGKFLPVVTGMQTLVCPRGRLLVAGASQSAAAIEPGVEESVEKPPVVSLEGTLNLVVLEDAL